MNWGSELLTALGPRSIWALAWIAVAACAALRRRALHSAGALSAWIPILAIFVLGCMSYPWPHREAAEATRYGDDAEAIPTEEQMRWEPYPEGTSDVLAKASWRDLQQRLLRVPTHSAVLVSSRSELRPTWIPPHWKLPSRGLLRAEAAEGANTEDEFTPAPRDAAWVMEHRWRVPTARTVAIEAWRLATSDAPHVLHLESCTTSNENWTSLQTVELDAGATRAAFEFEAPEPGNYALRLRRDDELIALTLSALEVTPAPRIRAFGYGLEALIAGWRAQGYDVVLGGELTSDDEVAVFGAGVETRIADRETERFLEEGGGVFFAHPNAWEAAQASEWGSALPARLLPVVPPEPTPDPTPSTTPQPQAPPPDEVPPQQDTSNAGRFALFVVLDLSGSFADSLTHAWPQVAATLSAADGFELLGIAGFNAEGRLLLPLANYGDALASKLEHERVRLQDYVREGGRHTYLTPALRIAADELAREKPSGALIVVVSDGILDDIPNKGGDWAHFAEFDLKQKLGYVIATIRIFDAKMPASMSRTGLELLDRLAKIGGTRSAVMKNDLGAALRVIPVVARQVQEASEWKPPNSVGEKPAPPEPTPEDTPPPPQPESVVLLPEVHYLHSIEGQPGELDETPWPALKELRQAKLGSAAAPAWLVAPRREPLLVTGTLGAGRVALAASALDADGWPGVLADPRFPAFAAKIADLLRRPVQPEEPWNARWRAGRMKADSEAAAARAVAFATELEINAAALPTQSSLPLQGSVRLLREGLVLSTLRRAEPLAGLEGERPLAALWETQAESSPAIRAAAEFTSARPASEHAQRWFAALALWLGAALILEAAAGIWSRGRLGAR